MTLEQNTKLAADVARERGRLWRFIRSRVGDRRDAEEILQDVLSELLEAYRLTKPIEQVGAWLIRVARNRIIDRFRAQRDEVSLDQEIDADFTLEDLLPDPDAGPEAAFAREVLMNEVFAALDELPAAQREIFIAHEIDGISFRDLAARSGVSINTLLSRKHQAVLHLRRRLQVIVSEYTELNVSGT